MANIEYNGGIVIRSTGAPKHVVAKRSLEEVLLVLKNIQQSFTGFNPYNEDHRKKVKRIINKTYDVKNKYVTILERCSEAIAELSKDGQFSRSYRPLLAFLESTSEAHSILPFMDLLPALDINPLDVIGESEFEKFTQPKYMDLISLRMEESVNLCKSYMSLLSGTMDLQSNPVNLIGLAAQALYLAKQKIDLKLDTEGLGNYSREIEEALETSTERFYSSTQSTILSYEPLIFFYLTNVIGNHFKASYENEIFNRRTSKLPCVHIRIDPWDDGISEEISERLNDDTLINDEFDDDDYDPGDDPNHEYIHVDQTNEQEPQREYQRFRDSMYEKVCITTRDNGLGIPEETLATLFEPDRVVDERYRSGNGRTLQVLPLVCDLLGADLYIESLLGKYTEFKLVLPRKQVSEGMIEID